MTMKTDGQVITITATINAPLNKVWDLFTGAQHIIRWNNASDDWQTSYAENNLKPGGKFLSRMEARDGSQGFDFTGSYGEVIPGRSIDYAIADGRKVHVTFSETPGGTQVTESFEAEKLNSATRQEAGWQAILDNFRKYVEAYGAREMYHFEITIGNSPENIFKIMLADETFRKWTSAFDPNSHFNGSWEKGKKILFLGKDAAGNTSGMACRIRENIPGRFLSIETLGEVIDGKEITTGERAEIWRGSLENYTLDPAGKKTLLSIDTDIPADFRASFLELWPEALAKLKSLCE